MFAVGLLELMSPRLLRLRLILRTLFCGPVGCLSFAVSQSPQSVTAFTIFLDLFDLTLGCRLGLSASEAVQETLVIQIYNFR